MLRKADFLEVLKEFLESNGLFQDFYDFVVYKKNIDFSELGFKDEDYGKDIVFLLSYIMSLRLSIPMLGISRCIRKGEIDGMGI